MSNQSDWFASKEAEAYMAEIVEGERQRMVSILESKDLFHAISFSLAALSFHSSSLRNMGMKETAIKVLKDALAQARKGV
jgi:hypothetical protein